MVTAQASAVQAARETAQLVTASPRVFTLAREACTVSTQICQHSRDLIAEGSRLGKGRVGFPRFFRLVGEIDGQPVRAVWGCGTLHGSIALLERGRLLVAMGERFVENDTGLIVEAGLEAALPAMLTLMRACDQVHEVQVGSWSSVSNSPEGREEKKAEE